MNNWLIDATFCEDGQIALMEYNDRGWAFLQRRSYGIELEYLFVHTDFRNMGLGTALVKHAQKLLKKDEKMILGATPIANCPYTRRELINWYEKRGFQAQSQLPFDLTLSSPMLYTQHETVK